MVLVVSRYCLYLSLLCGACRVSVLLVVFRWFSSCVVCLLLFFLLRCWICVVVRCCVLGSVVANCRYVLSFVMCLLFVDCSLVVARCCCMLLV